MSALGMANVMALGGTVTWWAARILRRRGIEIPTRIGQAAVTTFLLLTFLFGATGLARGLSADSDWRGSVSRSA